MWHLSSAVWSLCFVVIVKNEKLKKKVPQKSLRCLFLPRIISRSSSSSSSYNNFFFTPVSLFISPLPFESSYAATLVKRQLCKSRIVPSAPLPRVFVIFRLLIRRRAALFCVGEVRPDGFAIYSVDQ